MGLLLSGRLNGRLDNNGPIELSGPMAFILANNNESEISYTLQENRRVRFVSVVMELDEAENCGLPIQQIAGTTSETFTRFATLKAKRELQTLVSQISTCPLKGAARQLYLAGKALEVAVLISHESCKSEDGPCSTCPKLCALALQQVHEAKNILVESMEDPPTLGELASRVGMSPKKLTLGFQTVYGKSVFGVLQDHRLEQAHMLLASGDLNVSQVAYKVGYSVAHFSTVFRRHFGISPSQLR